MNAYDGDYDCVYDAETNTEVPKHLYVAPPEQPNLYEARRLHAAGFKLCKLVDNTKQPVGNDWQRRPVTTIDDSATGYGLMLAANTRCSIDPDQVDMARIAMGAWGFDLDAVMAEGARTISTRPGSGGRSMFRAADGLGWVKFRAKLDGVNVTVLELRANSTNLQDVVPGLIYGASFSQHYAPGSKYRYDDAPELPSAFFDFWLKMSTDMAFRAEREKSAIAALAAADFKCDVIHDLSGSKKLPFSEINGSLRAKFNDAVSVESILLAHGYEQHGNRFLAPGGTGQPGIRAIRGKDGLWQSDHGSDPLNGTFDAATAAVVLQFGYAVDAFEEWCHTHAIGEAVAKIEFGDGAKVGMAEMAKVAAAPVGVAAEPIAAEPEDLRRFDIPWPPGLVGEIAEYVRRGSFKPIDSFAIAAGLFAVALMSGNRYYIGKTGLPLNLYQILSAPTGAGKEAPRERMKALFSGTPFMRNLWEKAASAPGLLRRMGDTSPHIFAMMPDEFGIELQAYSGLRADPNKKRLVGAILALFNSARTTYLPEAYSDIKDTLPAINNPFMLLFGMTTPETLYPALNQEMVDSGMINRLLVVPRAGIGVNNYETDLSVPAELVKKVDQFAAALEFSQLGDPPCARTTDDIALEYGSGAFERLTELTGEGAFDKEGLHDAFWGRYQDQVMRVAGVLAIGDGGIITTRHVEWAHVWVDWCTRTLARSVTPHLAGGSFAKLTTHALDIIAKARTYSGDKKFAKLCSKGFMPESKLLKLLHVPKKEKDGLVAYLLETGEIERGEIDGHKALYIPAS